MVVVANPDLVDNYIVEVVVVVVVVVYDEAVKHQDYKMVYWSDRKITAFPLVFVEVHLDNPKILISS